MPIGPTTLVDTVGAGDSFHGGLLHYLAGTGHLGGRLESLTVDGLVEALTFASRVSAINCSRAGANPPWASEAGCLGGPAARGPAGAACLSDREGLADVGWGNRG